MGHAKRWAAGFLLAGSMLAVATPGYLALAAPSLAGYLLHPVLFLAQPVPFAACAALWLPRRAPAAAMVALTLAALLLAGTALAYVPMLWAPGARGGDMLGLVFVALPAGATALLLAGSAAAWPVAWWCRRVAAERPRSAR